MPAVGDDVHARVGQVFEEVVARSARNDGVVPTVDQQDVVRDGGEEIRIEQHWPGSGGEGGGGLVGPAHVGAYRLWHAGLSNRGQVVAQDRRVVDEGGGEVLHPF